MTLDISAIRQRIEKATPGENVTFMRYEHGGGRAYTENFQQGRQLVIDCYEEADRELYFNAAADLRALCDEIERLRALLLRTLHNVEHFGGSDMALGAEIRQAVEDPRPPASTPSESS